mgnify:FL=1|tara:strand:- start:1293 stop:1529 length:237 start_codon:yes stop_codon:yes gene_type:complete
MRLLVTVVDGGEGVGAGAGAAELAGRLSDDDPPPPPPHEVINIIIKLINNVFLWCILMNSRLLLIGVKINNVIKLIFF